MQVKDKSSLPYIIIDSESIPDELHRLIAEYPYLETIPEKEENIQRREKLLELYKI